jgi:hypothetical protein
MAKLAELDPVAVEAWLAERPPIIREMVTKRPPNLLYRMPTGHRVTIYSYSEDGTVSVIVGGQFNLIAFERNVFGVDPDTLVECDLPPADEPVGAMLTEKADIEAHVEDVRASGILDSDSSEESPR